MAVKVRHFHRSLTLSSFFYNKSFTLFSEGETICVKFFRPFLDDNLDLESSSFREDILFANQFQPFSNSIWVE